MIAITVSTKYDDLLNIILPQNARFFEKWYIITDPEDQATIQVIKAHNLPHVEIIYYDFYANGKIFNKGGAIRKCQETHLTNYTGQVLLLDSDIYLPDDFEEIIRQHANIQPNTLYGIGHRNDYFSLHHLNHQIVDDVYPYASNFQGFFQLYFSEPNQIYLYDESVNCGECDIKFINLFPNKIIIRELTVSHLGKSCLHWNTRLSKTDFLI
jgi:hypothetical protein